MRQEAGAAKRLDEQRGARGADYTSVKVRSSKASRLEAARRLISPPMYFDFIALFPTMKLAKIKCFFLCRFIQETYSLVFVENYLKIDNLVP